MEKVLAGSIRREMALEEFCAKQASEIMQLNRMVGFLVILLAANGGHHRYELLMLYLLTIIYRCNSTNMRESATPL